MKNPFPSLVHWFKGVPNDIQNAISGAVTQGVEHGEAEVLDLLAGVVQDIDFEPIRAQIVAALNKRAAELRAHQTTPPTVGTADSPPPWP